MAKGGITFARPGEAQEENPVSEEVGMEKNSDVLEVVVKNEPIETKIDTGSNREIQQLKKEEEMISREYEKRMKANQKSIKELKDVLRRDVNLGNAVQEEEMLKMKLEEIKQKMAAIEKTKKESEPSIREEAMKENESAAKMEKIETFSAESESLRKITPESISEVVQADGYESDKSFEKNEPAFIETAGGESSSAPRLREKSMQSPEAEMPIEAIIKKKKAPEIVPEKPLVQSETEKPVEQKIARRKGDKQESGKNLKEKIADNPECLAKIAGAIKEMFVTRKKWESMKDMAAEEIEANPAGRKRIISKIASFRHEHESVLEDDVRPASSETIKEWIARVIIMSMEKEAEVKTENKTEPVEMAERAA